MRKSKKEKGEKQKTKDKRVCRIVRKLYKQPEFGPVILLVIIIYIA